MTLLDAQDREVWEIAPGLRRVRAPNPSPMTEKGTNTYLIGDADIAVIDPGPALPAHLDRLMAEIGTGTVSAILVTHSHRDHSALASAIAQHTGAPILGFGDSQSGRSPVMSRLADGIGGGEGVDRAFRPDRRLSDGETVSGNGWNLTALWTPGHMGNHLCFAHGDILFTGDLVMGWSTSIVSPPDGDLAAFMDTCRKLAGRDDRLYLPGHGPAVTDPAARLAELIAHREARTVQVLRALSEGPARVTTLTRRVYHDVPDHILPAAERTLLAHLIALIEAGCVRADRPVGPAAIFEAVAATTTGQD
ncbi:MAG: MBL fold metallo-hydrolase [Rhodobacteraceae bacterium]|nr:MBL fold metallo-hydrolase [Paracoccaceae bacterium]